MQRIEVRLYGSLSATGIGHGTDNATIMGLMGEWPDAIDPTQIVPRIADLRETNTLQLDNRLPIEFVWARDMLLLDENLPYHPNAMTLIAEGEQGELHRDTYYSVGGGFVVDAAQPPAACWMPTRRCCRTTSTALPNCCACASKTTSACRN